MKQSRNGKWTQDNLDRLEQKMGQKSREVIQRMMLRTEDGQNPYDLDFSGREALAERLGKEVAAMLLDENLQYDLMAEVVQEASSWKCPRCGQDCPSHRDEHGNDAYEDAEIKTKVGKTPVKLRLFWCGKCRKVFSPLPTAH